MIGQTLSHFKITAKLGEGGMGEVYRAEDLSLEREVAIKVLPRSFVDDPERLARFEREAKVLASLNHPNIASIYQVGTGDADVHYLAMELAEGEDLADRLARGAVPLDEAMPLAIQIAEALEAAHERGIVHRDLKPANIKITPDGQVKVLDFGLAKAWDGPGGPGGDMTHSPTLTAQMTQAGTLLGTAAYMSPEQARGQEADRRADVWAFGLILNEMLSGRKTFNEPTVSDTLAAVLKTDPDLSGMPTETSPALRRLIERCLRKDPKQRLRDMGDVGLELREILSGGFDPGRLTTDPAASAFDGSDAPASSRLPVLLAGALAGLLLGLGAWWLLAPRRETPTTSHLIRFGISPPAGQIPLRGLAISPDGSTLAVALRSEDDERTAIWIRSLESLEFAKIEGTEGAIYPFWSPDSRRIGYFADYGLRVVDLLGTPPRELAKVGSMDEVRGATWSRDGTILYAPSFTGGLQRVDGNGGEPEPATILDPDGPVGTQRFPSFLPDGRHFVVYASAGSGGEPGWLQLGELGSTATRRLMESHSAAVYSPTGHLVYARGDVLVAHPFDAERLELAGDPIPLGPKLPGGLSVSGLRSVSVAANGTLVYRVEDLSRSRLIWRSRDGTVIGATGDEDSWYYGVSVSPDGRSVVAGRYPLAGDGDIWIYDRERGFGRPLVTGSAEDDVSVWSPDGRAIAFLSSKANDFTVEIQRLDDPATGRTVIYDGEQFVWPTQWLPDGSGILVSSSEAATDIALLDPDRPGELTEILATPFSETDGQVSPDGRWLAYSSDLSGRKEIYVRPFRQAGSDWQVSAEGGSRPRWSRDGRELFFLGSDGWLHAAAVTSNEDFSTAAPDRLFDPEIDLSQSEDPGYDVAPDGSFLLNQRAGDTGEPIVVVIGLADVLADLGAD